MSRCACTCGREAGEQTFAGGGCRDRYEQRMALAVEAARQADTRPDPGLDALKITARNLRRVLAVLRHLGNATTAEICQAQVGGTGGVKRIFELRRLGFEIDKEFVRESSWLYTLRGEPRPGGGVPAPVEPEQPAQESTAPNPYDYEDLAA